MKKIMLISLMMLFLGGCEDGSTIEFNLRTNVNDQYEWIYEIEDETILKIESLETDLESTTNGTYTDYNFEFVALKKGTTNIVFSYVGSETEDVSRSMTYEIKVDMFKNIEVLNKSGEYINRELPVPEIDN